MRDFNMGNIIIGIALVLWLLIFITSILYAIKEELVEDLFEWMLALLMAFFGSTLMVWGVVSCIFVLLHIGEYYG